MTDINITEERNQTSAVKNLIHFNNAGASLMPDIVVSGVKKYLDHEAKAGGYETAVFFENELDDFYRQAAKLINASSNEIAFTESATVAWQRAFHSIQFEEGDEIWTCSTEYASNYIAYLQLYKRVGVEIRIIPNNSYGETDPVAFSNLVTSKCKLISICHMPTANGLVNPIEAIGQIASQQGILYLVDACQSVGQYPLDVEKIKCDFLSVTGRKYLRGPRGTGFLYARAKSTAALEPLNLDLHGAEWLSKDSYRMRTDAKKYETWESNLSSKFGLAIALKYLNDLGITEIQKRVIQLASQFRIELNKIPHITTLDTGQEQSGIITFSSAVKNPTEIKQLLSEHGINVSVVVASSAILDLNVRKIKDAVRASVHYYNTEDEMKTIIEILGNI